MPKKKKKFASRTIFDYKKKKPKFHARLFLTYKCMTYTNGFSLSGTSQISFFQPTFKLQANKHTPIIVSNTSLPSCCETFACKKLLSWRTLASQHLLLNGHIGHLFSSRRSSGHLHFVFQSGLLSRFEFTSFFQCFSPLFLSHR